MNKLLASLLLLASCSPSYAYDYYQGSQRVIDTYAPPKVIYVAPQQRYTPPSYSPPATYYAPPTTYVAPSSTWQPIVTPTPTIDLRAEE